MNVKQIFSFSFKLIKNYSFIFFFLLVFFAFSQTDIVGAGKGNNGKQNAKGLSNAPSHICDLPVNGNSAVARHCSELTPVKTVVTTEPSFSYSTFENGDEDEVVLSGVEEKSEEPVSTWTVPEIDFSSDSSGDGGWVVLADEHK